MSTSDCDRPVWFLDVDGTIAPLGDDVSWANTFLYDHHPTLTSASVPYRPDILDRINRLHTEGLVEVRWLTTWEPRLTAHWEQVGLGPFTTASPGSDAGAWWKASAVEAWLTEHPTRRAVWTDDEIARRRPRQLLSMDRLLAISPNRYEGLTHDDLDLIEGWAGQRCTTSRIGPPRTVPAVADSTGSNGSIERAHRFGEPRPDRDPASSEGPSTLAGADAASTDPSCERGTEA